MSDRFQHLELKTLKEIPFVARISTVIPIGDGGFLVQYKDSSIISRFDSQFNLLWKKDIGISLGKFDSFTATVSADGNFIAVHGNSILRIMDKDGGLLHSRSHRPWASYQSSECYFSSGNTGRKSSILFFEPVQGGEGYLQVLDGSNYSLADSLPQEDMDNHYTFFSTPDENKVFVELAAGQDDGRLLEIEFVDGEIIINELDQCADRIMGSFSPNGEEFVTAPHYEEGIEIYSFPAIDKIADLSQVELFQGRDEYPAVQTDVLDYVVFYLSEKTLLAKTRFGRLLLIDRSSLKCAGELLLEGCKIVGYNDKGESVSGGDDIFDYEGEIWEIKLLKPDHLLVLHTSNVIKIYQVPAGI